MNTLLTNSNMEDLLMRQEVFYHILTNEEKRMTGKKQPQLNKSAVRNKFCLERQGKKCSVGFPTSFSFRACTKSLASLNRTTVSELQVNIPSEGNYLLLRTLELPVKKVELPVYGTSILVPVEDHLGEVTACCLYGHVLYHFQKSMSEVLPESTVFVLKEPCLKACPMGNFAVVVGSPTDFIKIDLSHTLAKDLENLGWREQIRIENNSQESSKLALKWKNKGNDFFAKGKHEDAIEAYLVSLEVSENSEIKTVLHLNLAAGYLILGLYELTVKHAKCVLDKTPYSEKALYRAGRAHYELRQYADAKHHFQVLLLKYPSNMQARSELKRCKARLEEGKGNIDIYKLYCLNRDKPSTPIDCGKYVGPIQLPSGPIRTRGIFATEDIKPGTLILAEKSIVVTFASSPCEHAGMPKFLQNATGTILRNPKTFGTEIYSLSTGNSKIDENQNMFCDETNRSEPIVDVYRIQKILFHNVFNTDKKMDKFYPSIWQLFPTACGFNHSCMANSNFLVYNDVMLVRTCSFISKGEEIRLPYLSNELTHSVKKTLLQAYRFQCKCLLCETDLTEVDEIHNRRDAIRDDLNALINGAPTVCLADLMNVITNMEGTYVNRSTLRVHLFRMYLPMALSYMNVAYPQWENLFMELIEKGLDEVGLSVDLLLRIAENEDTHFPKNTLIWDDLIDYASLIAEKEYTCGRTNHVKRWVKVLVFLERIFRGGNMQMLQDRFRNDRKMHYILSEFRKRNL